MSNEIHEELLNRFHHSALRHFERTCSVPSHTTDHSACPIAECRCPIYNELSVDGIQGEMSSAKQQRCKEWVEMSLNTDTSGMASWDGSIKYESTKFAVLDSLLLDSMEYNIQSIALETSKGNNNLESWNSAPSQKHDVQNDTN